MSTNQKRPDVTQPPADESRPDPVLSERNKEQPADAGQNDEQNKKRTYRGYLIAKVIVGVDVEARSAMDAAAKADTWPNGPADGWCNVGSYSNVSDSDPRDEDNELMYWQIESIDDLEHHFTEEDADDEPLCPPNEASEEWDEPLIKEEEQ